MFLFNKTYTVLVAAFVLVLTACVNQPDQPFQSTVKNNSRLHFSGKGAGAGIMLMSVMGSAGIAIGVAIDEGIAKQLDKTAVDGALRIERVVEDALRERAVSFPILNTVDVEVEQYGFVMASVRGGDMAVAQLHLRIRQQGATQDWLIRYPEDFSPKTNKALLVHDLEELKVDAESIKVLWEHATEQLLNYFESSVALAS